MGLDDFKGGVDSKPGIKWKKDRLHKEHLCPSCGEEAEHIRNNEWRCTTDRDKCEVITYFHVDFETDVL